MANNNVYIKEMQELVNPALAPEGNNLKTFYPRTHEKAVIDDDGNTLDSKIAALTEGVDNAYVKPAGGIPASDFAPDAIPSRDVQSDWNLSDTTKADYIKNKPNVEAKADKVNGATNNNFAALDSNGNLKDSGSKASDFATASQGTKADDTYNLIPTDAAIDNKLASQGFVNSSIATSTATFKGSKHLINDLRLSPNATTSEIASALDTAIIDADNNDYCFVIIPNVTYSVHDGYTSFTGVDDYVYYYVLIDSTFTLVTSQNKSTLGIVAGTTKAYDIVYTGVAKYQRYKYSSQWSYEYELNNSGFTAAQWEAINSTITDGLVTKLQALPSNDALTTMFSGKQDTINDIATIRSGAAKGSMIYDTGITTDELYTTPLPAGTKQKLIAIRNNQSVVNNSLLLFGRTQEGSYSVGTLITYGSVCRIAVFDGDSLLAIEGSPDNSVWTVTEKPYYSKPSTGIPSTDFTSTVQTSLGKADTALQPSSTTGLVKNDGSIDSNTYLTQHQDITGKADKVTNATSGNLAGLDSNGNLTDSGIAANGVVSSTSVRTIVTLTQAQYDALATKDANTEYNIIESV